MIAAARACIGTPFHHQGRQPGAGLDCIGLVVIALKAAGVDVRDRTDYARQPAADALQLALEAHGFSHAETIAAGDVLLFRFNRAPQHVALATESTRMIHAYAPIGKVVECSIGASWKNRLCGIYRVST